jgi:hypothetical protein
VTEEAVAVALDRPYVEPASALLGL